MSWDEMEETNPPQCFYSGFIDAVLATGEHLVLKHHFKLWNGVSGIFGQILLVENKKFICSFMIRELMLMAYVSYICRVRLGDDGAKEVVQLSFHQRHCRIK
jgi:hypothetical protein